MYIYKRTNPLKEALMAPAELKTSKVQEKYT